MAANKPQGSYFGLFLAGATVLGAGAAGMGKLLVLIGVALIGASLFGFVRIKHLEGKTALTPSPEAMKWVGAGVSLLGWVVTIGGLHLTASNGGRLVLALVGIAVSLFGILVVLPVAFRKTAFWKGPEGTSAQSGFTGSAPRNIAASNFSPSASAMESTR